VQQTQSWRKLGATWLWRWHVCSLDAPTVAVLWALAVAHLAGVALRLVELLVLGLGTWIVYVLDRVLDGMGRRGNDADLRQVGHAAQQGRGGWPEPVLRERHYFHARHRRLLLWLCGAAGCLVGLLCCLLPLRLVALYLVLGIPVSAYGLWVHARLLPMLPALYGRDAQGEGASGRGPRRARFFRFGFFRAGAAGIVKEAAVAVLFTSAVVGPAVVAIPGGYRSELLIPALLLTALCWLNCSLISHAEQGAGSLWRGNDRARLRPDRLGLEGLGLEGRRLIRQRLYLKGFCIGLFGAAAAWALDRLRAGGPYGRAGISALFYPLAVMLSCLILLALLVSMGRENPAPARTARLRVLADVGLLTPLLFMLPHA
jgi:hypothetical protein